MLEMRYERRGPVYLGRLARRLRVIEPTRLADLLDDAVDEGRLTFDERQDVMRAALVLRGRRLSDDTEVYVLAELSVGIGLYDVERAGHRAAILEKLGRPVIPVVGGLRIDEDSVRVARERGVWVAVDGQITPPVAS